MISPDFRDGPRSITSQMASRSLDRRVELGLTQADVARHLELSIDDVSAYEGGHVLMTVEVKYRLCSIYNVSPDWFYEGLQEAGLERPNSPTTAGFDHGGSRREDGG